MRHGGQGGRQLALQHFFGFVWVVDIAVVAIARIGQLLHQALIVVAGAKAQGGEGNARFALFGHHAFEGVEIGDAHVEIAIGGQQNAVDAVFNMGFFGFLIGQLNGLLAGGGATCLQAVNRAQNGLFLAA